jgi:hypothetical protein
MTRQAATMTQTVSAATPAACVADWSSARAVIGSTAAIVPMVMASRRRRGRRALGNDVTSEC